VEQKDKMGGVGIAIVDETKPSKEHQNQNSKIPNGVGRCIPKPTKILKYEITSNKIGQYIQYMRDHAIIDKFMGIWPMEKSLKW
jgi:hypothetical protein